jgi:tetratricopeptide (TPR) repeat protein
MRVLFLALAVVLACGQARAADPADGACTADPIASAGERILACTDLIRAGASLYDAYMERAAAYADSGDRAAAETDLSAAIALSPDRAAAYSARGVLYLKDEAFRDGLVDLDRALTLAPDDEATLRARAFAWDELGNFPAAIADYDRLLTLTADPGYRYFRGFAYFSSGDDAAALADFATIAGAASPTLSAWGLRGEGAVHERQGDLSLALGDYGAALAADPSDDRAFAGRCRVETELGQPGGGCAAVVTQAAVR